MNDDISFLARMMVLIPKGHATPEEYERLNEIASLSVRFATRNVLDDVYAEHHRLESLRANSQHPFTEAESARYALTQALIGLDSLLAGAWGTQNLQRLGGGKLQIERALVVLWTTWSRMESES